MGDGVCGFTTANQSISETKKDKETTVNGKGELIHWVNNARDIFRIMSPP